MRLLVVSFAFPPYNSIGGVRVGKTAKYLTRFGHDVRVLTARDQPFEPTLPVELPAEKITYTRWLTLRRSAPMAEARPTPSDQNRTAAPASRNRGAPAESSQTDAPAATRGLRQLLARHVKALLDFPDSNAGWLPYAVSEAARLAKGWRPELIFASSPPPTSLLVARQLGKRFGVPWVADLRDLWLDHPYYDQPAWRARLEARLERRVLGSAAGFVTVSQPLADRLREKYGREAAVVLNGYDGADYPEDSAPPRGGPLRILYTGMIYPGRRDPSPLFAALRLMGGRAERVRVVFHGFFLESARNLAREHGVEHLVEVNPPVPYHESLRMQTEADVLLLLLWSDPTERGVYTGKLFEYLGARRPVLAVGGVATVAADLVRERRAGAALDDPAAIAAQLTDWIKLKEAAGALPALPAEVGRGLSREEQTRALEDYFRLVLARRAGAV
jgi:glycosyltransferase involved in cell wall biosynthesis